jgi:hypothetical protein
MKPSRRHHAAEEQFRQLLRDAEVTAPDRVEYAVGELTFFWDQQQVAVVVELDPPVAA